MSAKISKNNASAKILDRDSAANKGQSTVNYRQSLAIDRPCLLCNDHSDRWVFQIFFIIILKGLF